VSKSKRIGVWLIGCSVGFACSVDASTFEFTLSVPRDPQFASMVRGLAVQAARYASCGHADAESFAGSVEAALHACLREASSDATISVVVRRDAGPLEFLIDGRTIAVEP
jgi:hypothetical protein